MKRKLIYRILITPLVLAGILLIGAYFLIATEIGTQWLIKKSATYVPGIIIVNDVHGRLIDEFVIRRVQFKYCENVSELNDIRIRWNFKKLFSKVFELHEATLGSGIINVDKQCEDKTENKLPDEIKLPIKVVIQKFNLNEIIVKNENKEKQIKLIKGTINVDSDGYKISELTLLASEYQIKASLNGKLKQPFQAAGDIQWNFIDKNKTSWKGQIELNGDVNEIHGKHALHQPLQVDSEITVIQPLQELKFTAKNKWSSLALPIEQDAKITLENGDFQLEGDLRSVSFALTTNVSSHQLPSSAVLQLKGIANQQEINFSDIQVNSNQGDLSGYGQINLEPTIKASFAVQGRQINPQFIIAELPGKLNINTDIKLFQSEQEIAATIDIKDLSGTLQDYDVKGNGKLHYVKDEIQAEQLNLVVGENTLYLNGILGTENNKANFEIIANDLSQLHPQISGSVKGKGSLEGSIKTPNIEAFMTGEQVKVDDRLKIANFSVDGNLYVFSDEASNARIQAKNILVKDTLIDSVDLTANGNQKQHQADFVIQSKDIKSLFNISGRFSDETWYGAVNQMHAEVPLYGKWELDRHSELQYGPQGFSLTSTCLRNTSSSVCLEGSLDAKNNWQAKGKISDFPLQMLAKNYEDRFTIEGVAFLEVDINGKGSQFEGSLKSITQNSTFHSAFLDEIDESFLIKRLEINGNLTSASSKIDLNIDMDKGQASGLAIVENFNDRDKAYIREATFSAKFPSIKFLNVMLPNISINEGSLSAQAEVRGHVKRPQIESNISLADLKFYVPDLGTEYSDGRLYASSKEWNIFDLKGGLQSEGGNFSIDGKINTQDKITYSLNLKGEKFKVLHLPDKSLVLSPDLEIIGTASKIDITGLIEIPSANLVLRELPKGTVKTSADQVIVSEQQENLEAEQNKAIDVTGKVQLVFGDDIHFEGKGIQTDLIGELLVSLENTQVPNGQGVLAFKNATYQVLGQTLDISSGKMLFAGPINNPELDVKVTRSSGEVTAGIKIEGTVEKPRTQVFSSPVMSDGNALSYLISGRPLAEASESQNALLVKAALSLGIGNSASITQQIGSSIGLDELSVSGDEGLESTSFILGKYLSPRLYLSYAHGLFTDEGVVELDYQLTDHISVEGESGEDQAIDLMYTLERD